MAADDCIFCKSISGEIPSKPLFEDDDMIIINDIQPQAPVHLLLIPKKHIEMITTSEEADQELLGKLIYMTKIIAHEIGVKENSYRVVINNGEYAGQAVCIDCHDTEANQISSDEHSDLSCEVCHGPGTQHVENNEIKLEKPGTRIFCGQCHGLHLARSIEVINQVDTKEHYPEREDCIDCHNPHAVWELKD